MMPSTNDVCRLHKETDCILQSIGNFVSTDRLTTVDDPKYAIPKEIVAPGKHCGEINQSINYSRCKNRFNKMQQKETEKVVRSKDKITTS